MQLHDLKTRLWRSFAWPIVFGFLAACSSSGGDGGDPDPPIADVAGEWSISETMGANDCGESGVENYTVTVTTNGNSVTVQTPAGTFTGTIDGARLRWTGSYPEDGGTTTITGMRLTVAADGNSFSGTTDWRWTDGTFNCSGSTTVSGQRLSGPPGGGGGGGGNEVEPNDTFGQAQTITAGSISGTVSSSSDEFDWFLFTAPTGGSYSFMLTWSNVQNDVDLQVIAASGTCDSDEVDTTSESCNGIALNGGESVFVRVRGFATSGAQAYTLTVQ